jgi:hypothetical protein
MRKTARKRFVLCVENRGYTASLEKRKIYEVRAPVANDPDFMIRVVDESGDDYLFPAKWFIPLELPAKARRAMTAV